MLALESSLDRVVDEVKIVEEGAGAGIETGISGGMLFSLLLLSVFDRLFSALESWRSSLKGDYNINIQCMSVDVCQFLNRNIEHPGFPSLTDCLFSERVKHNS